MLGPLPGLFPASVQTGLGLCWEPGRHMNVNTVLEAWGAGATQGLRHRSPAAATETALGKNQQVRTQDIEATFGRRRNRYGHKVIKGPGDVRIAGT